MKKNQKPKVPISLKAKLIYNPHAGMKRRLLPNPNATSLEDIKETILQYQIPADYFPTKMPGHASELAHEAIKEGYKMVLVAGGDGTVGEAANGLVNSEMPLGIIPLGSFMNVARMLSIPLEMEKAIEIIKIGRIRKIDVGSVVKMNGERLSEPYYFLESAGIGLEAQLHENVLEWERGNWLAPFKILKTLMDFYGYPGKLTIDGEEIETKATIATISNGPYTGAAIPIAPKAKLNDHKLTVSLFKMSKLQLFKYLLQIIRLRKHYSPKVEIRQGDKVKIETEVPRMVHADARFYGMTPVEFKIIPNALSVISGFPKPGESALVKRTYLDP